LFLTQNNVFMNILNLLCPMPIDNYSLGKFYANSLADDILLSFD